MFTWRKYLHICSIVVFGMNRNNPSNEVMELVMKREILKEIRFG